jgi:hypothetical protein
MVFCRKSDVFACEIGNENSGRNGDKNGDGGRTAAT